MATWKCKGCGLKHKLEEDEEMPLTCPECGEALDYDAWIPDEG